MKRKISVAHGHYERGTKLESEDAAAARAAYQACLNGDCSHLEARINLGRLLHAEGRLKEADAIYRAANEPSAILYFNWGVLLEDLKERDRGYPRLSGSHPIRPRNGRRALQFVALA